MLTHNIDQWHEFRREIWYLNAKTTIDEIDWDLVWDEDAWSTIDGQSIIGDLLLSNTVDELKRLQILIKSEGVKMQKRLKKKMRILDESNIDHDNPEYSEIHISLEKIYNKNTLNKLRSSTIYR